MSGPATSSFPAIGTTVSVVVTDPRALAESTELVRRHVAALDAAASRFRDDSELRRLNAAGGKPMEVSWLLLVAIEDALRAADQTGGLVDPTVGESLRLCGYDSDFSQVSPASPAPVARVRPVPGWRTVRVDRERRAVTMAPAVRLDLGATAKAGCADRAALAAAALGGCGVLVNLGGDVAVAGPPPGDGWVIRIADRHDAAPTAPGVTVALHGGGLASSGTAARRWSRGGRMMHHIIDPSTGEPAGTRWRTVTVAADSCLAANTATTAGVVLGDRAPSWLATRGLPGRLVPEVGQPIAVGDWPRDALLPSSSAPRAS